MQANKSPFPISELPANIQAYDEPSLKEQNDQEDFQAKKDKNARKNDLHALRINHAEKLFKLICCWIVMLWILLFIKGFLKDEFDLDPSVIIAAITSTTASVLGLYGIAAYWMFGKKTLTDDSTQEM